MDIAQREGGGVKACHGSEHFFSKVCPGVQGLAGMFWNTFFPYLPAWQRGEGSLKLLGQCPCRTNTFQKGASQGRLDWIFLICVRPCCRDKYWSDRLHETGCGVVGSETGIRGPNHLVPVGFCALHGWDSLLPLSDFRALLCTNMARSGSYFHLVFILLPLLISGQVDSVDKLDPVDKACEEGINCVHKNECEGDYHHH